MSQSLFIAQTTVPVVDLRDWSLLSQHTSRPRTSLSEQQESINSTQDGRAATLSRTRMVILITTLTGIMFVGSMSSGLSTIGLPVIAADLKLPDNLLMWPVSVYHLANGCCLLLVGSMADLMGNRMITLLGCLLLAAFILGCGVAESGIQLILFRTFQGIATSMCLPTAFSISTQTLPMGKPRNIGFACLGSSLGWRFGFYLCAGVTGTLMIINYFKLPVDAARQPITLRRLKSRDRLDGHTPFKLLLRNHLLCLRYISDNPSNAHKAQNIALLCCAGAMIPGFWVWMGRRERAGKPALIPTHLWKNTAFLSKCVIVLFSLFFQEFQELSGFQSALRFLPNVFIGVLLNLGTGLLVHWVHANHLVLVSSLLSAGSPLLMAIIDPQWSWWYCAFWAVLLSPLSADVIFTIANLIAADAFTPQTRGLAGAVFNTIAEFGTSLGLTIFAFISAGVTRDPSIVDKQSPEALMVGYRAVFWTCFGLMLGACGVG
ncbi:MFS general substrate transporter [Aspergillus uvarum CBS 121591]|uniref:MFS general substrate transporter n=1 Tax=Aspergillus uvarum CBS 121591 TaxID=1448315 RepID=A0A319CNT3_9EURO|nr:MFS general substrate transporter [Aspergillus uvarum CBS 121591]PYH86280.1 MFS general substrate transporter [Aspergillus uvarum CBS 121591]